MSRSKLLTALISFISAAFVTSTAIAAVPASERASTTGGFGAWLIDSLFEAGTLKSMPSDSGMIGSIIQPFSLACMLVVVFIIIFKSVQHVLIVAQAKDPESSPIALTWAPLHLVFAVALAMPMPSGYSMGQYAAIWVAQQSNMLGNIIAERVVSGEEYTVFTEVPLPHVRETVLSIVDAQVCRTVMNSMGTYVSAQQNGAGMNVQPVELSREQVERMYGLADNDENAASITRKGVAYSIQRTGDSGDFIQKTGEVDEFCGSLMVEYNALYNDKNIDLGQETSGSSGGTSGPHTCERMGLMCGISSNDLVNDATRKKERSLAGDAFAQAHDDISAKIMAAAGARGNPSGNVSQAVDALTYDINNYFASLTEAEAKEDLLLDQFEAHQKIQEASNATVKEIAALQRSVYSAYGSALNTLRSKNSAGDSHADAVARTGWTALGLYWFQQQSYNSQVLGAVNFNSASRIDYNQIVAKIEQTTNDPLLANRIHERIKRYRQNVNQAILNTRLDDDPITSGSSDGQSTAKSIDQSIRASSIKESLPTYIASMKDSAAAGQGATTANADSYGPYSPSKFIRNYVFQPLVGSLQDDNIVTGLVNLGHYMIVFAEAVYAMDLIIRTTNEWAKHEAQNESSSIASKALNVVFSPAKSLKNMLGKSAALSWIGFLIKNFMEDLTPLVLYMFFLGVFLAFYLPAVVMIQWIIGIFQWLLYIVEGTVVIPLWAILFASDMGQKAFAPQTAQQGLIHLVSILMYPALMIIGFVIGLKILDLASYFLIDYVVLGFLNMTSGHTFGIVSVFAGLTLIGLIAYQVIMRVFSGMLELNDKAIGWIGNRASFGENQTEQATRSAMVAVISRGESMAHRTASGKGGKPKM